MEHEETENQQISPSKKTFRKKGGNYLLISNALLAVSLIMYYAIDIQGGIFWALVNLAFLVILILAIIALIRGYSGK